MSHVSVGTHSVSCTTNCLKHNYRSKGCSECLYCTCFMQIKDAILSGRMDFFSISHKTDMTKDQCNAVLNEMVDCDYLGTQMVPILNGEAIKVVYFLNGSVVDSEPEPQ